MQEEIGLNRQISIMLILNAFTGFLYTSLPNSYLVKADAYSLCLFLMAILASLISYLVWRYGKYHQQKKQASAYLPLANGESAWEGSLKVLLPLCFIPLFALVGSRTLIVFWGYFGQKHEIDAQLIAHSEIIQGRSWWTLKFGQPLNQTLSLAVPAALLATLQTGDKLQIQYRETPLAFHFTSLNDYWKVEKITN